MFPQDPTMICRRCVNIFSISNEGRIDALRMNRFECPSCRYETVGSGIRGFLKFYPRLVSSEKMMALEGICLTDYTIGDIMGLGIFNWLKERMHFLCKSCSYEWSIKFDPDTLHYKQNPKTFFCPSCLLSPKQEITRELFMSLNQTFEGSMKFSHAQWDLFAPIGKQPPLNKIQSRIYAEKFSIQQL